MAEKKWGMDDRSPPLSSLFLYRRKPTADHLKKVNKQKNMSN
jgi:hypothetical protein